MVTWHLPHPTLQRPNAARISALSGAMFINALALGLLLLPLTLPRIDGPVVSKPPDEWVEFVPLPVPPVPLPPTIDVPETPPPPQPVAITPPDPSPVIETAALPQAPTPPVAIAPVEATPTTAPATPYDVEALAYEFAPEPSYPAYSMRRREEGTVLLRVLVGADGSPLEVRVLRSSGHRRLDDAAVAQVLGRWRFKPAVRDGVPVQAIGKVPIRFSLRGG